MGELMVVPLSSPSTVMLLSTQSYLSLTLVDIEYGAEHELNKTPSINMFSKVYFVFMVKVVSAGVIVIS